MTSSSSNLPSFFDAITLSYGGVNFELLPADGEHSIFSQKSVDGSPIFRLENFSGWLRVQKIEHAHDSITREGLDVKSRDPTGDSASDGSCKIEASNKKQNSNSNRARGTRTRNNANRHGTYCGGCKKKPSGSSHMSVDGEKGNLSKEDKGKGKFMSPYPAASNGTGRNNIASESGGEVAAASAPKTPASTHSNEGKGKKTFMSPYSIASDGGFSLFSEEDEQSHALFSDESETDTDLSEGWQESQEH